VQRLILVDEGITAGTLDFVSWLKWIAGFGALVVMVYACALPGRLAVGRDDDTGLSGLYTVNGVGPDGSEYSGTLTIIDTEIPQTYAVQWLVTGARQEGTGTIEGNRLIVEWDLVDNATGDGTGTIEYRIDGSGEMTGSWTVDGFDEPGTEQVFPEP
jgi:hypothetical protein